MGENHTAAIVVPALKNVRETRGSEARMEEAAGLAEAIGLHVTFRSALTVSTPRPSHYLGQGQVASLAAAIKEQEIALLIFDGSLSPVQQRNLEKDCGCKVIDRTALILEIFGARARTHEGKLQVELAALTYQKSRLVRSWTHLERQRGGFGFLGGPGESQIEIDRRLIGGRIDKIKRELATVQRTRRLQRGARSSVPYPVVALVGYTNAGKSTLFNRLTGAEVMAKDMLFATLDPTMRLVNIGIGTPVILSDTVGFIADLPTPLIAAFRATLEEVLSADLLLQVRDISHPDTDQQKQDVLAVLREIGVSAESLDDKMIEVWNKIDLLPPDAQTKAPKVVPVSALTGEGIELLRQAIGDALTALHHTLEICLPLEDGENFSWLHRNGRIVAESCTENTRVLKVQLSDAAQGMWEKRQATPSTLAPHPHP